MRSQHKLLSIVLFALLLVPFSTKAETIFACGPSQGYGVYWSELQPEKDFVFGEDKISQGSFSLVKTEDEYDIVYSDASNKTNSARAEGAQVVVSQAGTNFIMVTVIYPEQTVETYHFFKFKDSYHAVYSTNRHHAAVSSGRIMKAECE